MSSDKVPLEDIQVPVKLKLAALWTSVMFLYLYADYFGLFIPGHLQKMLDGQMPPLGPTTQGALLFASSMVAIPGVMVFLSVALKPAFNRWLNVGMGVLYTLIICITMWSWDFFIVYGVLEIALTGLVVWYAWKWPRRAGAR
jgi:hypothetical protein